MDKSDCNLALENIYSRTSVRSYLDKTVENEKVGQILKAAMSAPTAKNSQPWAFVVVKEKKILKELADALPHAKMCAEASLAIAVCGDLSKALKGEAEDYWIVDTSAATENILLAAHALGLGAVWTGVYPITERVLTVKRVLKLPENVIPLCVIPIGYPDGPRTPKNKWVPGNIHYDNW